MALTRKMLKAMGIEDEKIDQIIEAHAETVDALKSERDSYKENSEKLEEAEKELTTLRKTVADGEKAGWEDKYNNLKKEFDTYKSDQATKEVTAAKDKQYRKLLAEAGVSEKRIDSIMKVTDLNSMKLAEDGTLDGAAELTKTIKADWADFISTSGAHGAGVSNPPSNNGGSAFEAMSLVDKMNYANAHPDAPEVVEWMAK